jgi:hypothetical protein
MRVVEGEGVASWMPRSKYVLFPLSFSPHVNKKKVSELQPERVLQPEWGLLEMTPH